MTDLKKVANKLTKTVDRLVISKLGHIEWREIEGDILAALQQVEEEALGQGHDDGFKEAQSEQTERIDKLEELVEDVCFQFGHSTTIKSHAAISSMGLSTLEDCFDILSWDNPHLIPECECDIVGCYLRTSGGHNTWEDGPYVRVCSKHSIEVTHNPNQFKGRIKQERLDAEKDRCPVCRVMNCKECTPTNPEGEKSP